VGVVAARVVAVPTVAVVVVEVLRGYPTMLCLREVSYNIMSEMAELAEQQVTRLGLGLLAAIHISKLTIPYFV
jgi:hypothetical protein